MEKFNYDNSKYLNLVELDTKKIEEIYKDYEVINYSIEADNLLMNDVQVAKIIDFDSEKPIKNLNGTVDFDKDKILSVSYTE
ncbi:hypothetical protein G9V12_09755 [Staphylococcus aureus]|uniref:hypothetical protein n=1 Tax=Staphylococcus aureus TaxID=1280 RepID=UPI0013F68BAF|nr:hypothetical protein [Staphylococcus aureus]NHE00887.1 hypothetical protein [Staphylococcus aureus]